MSNRVLEYIISARDRASAIVQGFGETVKRTAKTVSQSPLDTDRWKKLREELKEFQTSGRHSAGYQQIGKDAGAAAPQIDRMSNAMSGGIRTALGLRVALRGGQEAIGGMINAVHGLSQAMPAIATRFAGGIAAFGVGWQIGKAFENTLHLSDRFGKLFRDKLKDIAAKSREQFDLMNNVRLDGLKRELEDVARLVDVVAAGIEKSANRTQRFYDAVADLTRSKLETELQPGPARDAQMAGINRSAALTAIDAETGAAAKRRAELNAARVVIDEELRDLEHRMAQAQGRYDKLRGEIDKSQFAPNDPARGRRIREARNELDSANSTIRPEITSLERQREAILQQIEDLQSTIDLKPIRIAIAENKYKAALSEAAEQEQKDAKELAKQQAQDAKELAREQQQAQREALAEWKRTRNEQIDQEADRIRRQLDVGRETENGMRDRLLRAQSASAQAWGWYRNRDSFRAQLAEEKANAEAEKQFARDSQKLQRIRGWESAKLGEDMEVVRRVVMARREEAAAAAALVKIEANTRLLDAKLDELIRMK